MRLNEAVRWTVAAILATCIYPWTAAAGVDGDNCATALPAPEGSTFANSTGLGTELQVSCAVNSGADIWFVHTANCDGLLLVTTNGSAFDTVLAAFGECGSGELACDDDGGVGLASAIMIPVLAGEDYFLRVAGFGGASGAVQLNISRVDTCFVGGVCYQADEGDPATPCLICDPEADPDGWSPALEGTACGESTPTDPQCDLPDTCDGAGVCDSNFKPSGTACGDPTNTDCDNPDTCNGAGSCADNLEPMGTSCGDPADTDCDNPDTCDGAGGCLLNFEDVGFACGDPADTDCDNPDTCDGTGGCLLNFEDVGFACGDPADTDCDNPDTCDGTGGCFDNFELPGSACGDPGMTECDNPDSCDASGGCQPNYQLAGVACGDPTSTECDSPDTCDGGGACAQNLASAGTSCGNPANTDCDNPDSCDGAGGCLDNFEAASTACGSPADTACDNPDTCNGVGDCLVNFEPVGTSCGSPANTECDNPDTCNSTGACQSNAEPAGQPCGDPTNTDCNGADSCNGAGGCLLNLVPAGTACGSPANTECDNPDTCNGAGTCLGNFEPEGTPCPDVLFCDGEESCAGGACVDNPGPCLDLAHCNEANDTCLDCLDFTDCGDLDMDGISDNNCLWYSCQATLCSSVPRLFADLGGQFGICPLDGTTDNNDRFHALNCFADTNTLGQPGYPCEPDPPSAINVDAGGQFGDCCPDGVCDANDAFHVLNTFQGTGTCSCPGACPSPSPAGLPQTEPLIVGSASVSLVAERSVIRRGDVVRVDVLLGDALADLRGYQLHVQVRGGKSGRLELLDMTIEKRSEWVFSGAGSWQAFNLRTGQMLAGLSTPGVATQAGAYLATLSFAASADASGSFLVDLAYDDPMGQGRTFLFATPPQGKIEITGTHPAEIRIKDSLRSGSR
jgi:hypothetical protein